jgi:hypothetical protein
VIAIYRVATGIGQGMRVREKGNRDAQNAQYQNFPPNPRHFGLLRYFPRADHFQRRYDDYEMESDEMPGNVHLTFRRPLNEKAKRASQNVAASSFAAEFHGDEVAAD